MGKTFYIIDGNSFAYRAFYALPPLTTKDGIEIQAVYGFYNMLLKIIKEKNPDYLAIAFDHPKPTFRHKLYEQYKIQRQPMPESLQNQLKIIKEILKNAGIANYEMEGYEADDIIAALVYHLSADKNLKVIIASGDKDMLQLLSENVCLLKFTKDGEVELTPEKVKNEMGIEPKLIIDILSLMGDASDNIPGVKGIGEKTAFKLINEFKNIDNLLMNIEKVKPERIKNLIKDNIENIKISRELAILKENPELIKKINFSIVKNSIEKIEKHKLDEEFVKYNFKTLLFDKNILKEEINVKKEIKQFENIKELIGEINKNTKLSLFFCGETNKTEIVCIKVGNEFYFTFNDIVEFYGVLDDKLIITNSAKEIFKRAPGIKNAKIYDIMLFAYLLNPDKTYKDFSHIYNEYLNKTFLSFEDVAGKGAKKIMVQLAEKSAIEKYVFMLLEYSERLNDILLEKLKKEELIPIYESIELPLSKVLAEMENQGLRIDEKLLDDLIAEIKIEISEIEKKIYEYAGVEFNINSPKQLADVLFNKLNLPVQKKIKTGFSTDNEVLKALITYNEIVPEILKYRTYMKYKTSFLDVIKEFLDKNKKIYPVYNQNIAATGRLSSSNPNIQNIPVKDEKIREIRKIFLPLKENEIVLKADYSQIELRILAHMANDEGLINIFNNNGDVHSMVAANIFGVKEDEITREQRRIAKTINFGIIYGMSAFGLSKELDISQGEAKNFIEKFFKTFPDVKEYQENTIEFARKNGFVQTLFGRKRFLPDILSKNKTIRELAERAAINAPIQGTAADIIKKAMIDIYNQFKEQNLGTKIILQIHDELILSVPEKEKEVALKVVKDKMENSVKLKVPVTVNTGFGKNWYECG